MRILRRCLITVAALAVVAGAGFIKMHSTPHMAIRANIFENTIFEFRYHWQPLTAFAGDYEFTRYQQTDLYRMGRRGYAGGNCYTVKKTGPLYFAHHEPDQTKMLFANA